MLGFVIACDMQYLQPIDFAVLVLHCDS